MDPVGVFKQTPFPSPVWYDQPILSTVPNRVKGRWLFRVVSIHWAILAELVLWVLQYFMEVPINQLEEPTVGYKYIESIYRVELLKQPTYPYLFHIFVG